jgi:membrane protein implicated in regulation of membrane protease activity
MDVQLLAWHWLVLGILLVIGEIFVPSFTILWFGLGAIVVGLVALAVDLSFSTEVLLWTCSSVACTVLWFMVFKPRLTSRNTDELAQASAIGEAGQVVKLPTDRTPGKIRFTTPILGEDEWEFTCETSVALGDRLYIKAINGTVLVVANAV